MTSQIIDRQLDQPSTLIGIVLGQILHTDGMTTPGYIMIIADDVHQKWQERRCEHEVARQLLDQIDPVPAPQPEPGPDERSALHAFVDEYTHQVERRQDLPNDTRERLWLAHALQLAPQGHPIHASAAARIGADPGV
jgi:hypothetical protein